MAIYAIHCPPLVGDVARAFDRARIVETGFSRSGFVFGPLWLLANGLWLPLLVWIVVAGASGFAEATGWLAYGGASAIYLLATLLVGLEGRNWLGEKYSRAGLPLIDVIEARDDNEAARVFLCRALVAPPPAPSAVRAANAGAGPIIGLFPEAQRS